MATVSSGVSLSSTYYLRQFYKEGNGAFKASVRNDYSNTELSYDDALALKKAVKQLASYKFDDEDENEANIKSSVLAFIDTYNNALSSSGSSDVDLSRYAKQLKKLSSSYSDSLEEIGITVNKDGSLTASTSLLESASLSKVQKVFSSDSNFMKKTSTIARGMSRNSSEAVYAQLTGSGGNVNIKL